MNDFASQNFHQEDTQNLPIWIRLPTASQRDVYTGLTRSVLYRLIREGRIESKVIRQEGKPTGVRLIRLRSLLDYIDTLDSDFCDIADGTCADC